MPATSSTTAIASTSPLTPAAASRFSKRLTEIETALKILAYLVGGAWVYFNFFKGRTYRPRLETRVSGELCRQTTPELVRAVVQVKNVGLAKVDVAQRGTGLRILVFDDTLPDKWKHVATLPLLTRHAWIEPNEVVEEQTVLPLKLSGVAAVRIESIITGRTTMWEASTIII